MFLLFSLLSSPANAADELFVFGVDNFGGSGECCSGCDDFTDSVNFATWFRYHFSSWVSSSTWDSTSYYANLAVDPEDFTDSSEQTWGADENATYGIDAGDIGYLSSHGNASCDEVALDYSISVTMGQAHSSQDCTPEATNSGHTDVADEEIRFGDGDLDMVFLDACNTVQHCAWNGGVFDGSMAGTGGANHLALWAGYHGLSYDDADQETVIKAFVFWSKTEGVGDNWIDYRYENRGGGVYQCPAVVTWGDSETNASDVYWHGGFSDRAISNSTAVARAYRYNGCDPADGYAW